MNPPPTFPNAKPDDTIFDLAGDKMRNKYAVISIVTPTYNSERYLDTTMASVIEQESGDYPLKIMYHIEDGGSSDGTLEIARRWKSRVEALPKSSGKEIVLTISSEPDRGMYDAINKGFARLPIQLTDLMTWINSDDVIAPGAFSAATSITARFPEVTWLGGRASAMDERGAVTGVFPAVPFFTEVFRSGKYDGRGNRPFLMQEGTFWRPSLWERAGGLDATFKLAGDWDLWRRFAEFADYTAVDSVFAFHRKRPGQLSENLSAYHAEIDERRGKGWPKAEVKKKHAPSVLKFDYAEDQWVGIMETKRKTGYLRSSKLGYLVSELNHKRLQKRREGRKEALAQFDVARCPTKFHAPKRIKS